MRLHTGWIFVLPFAVLSGIMLINGIRSYRTTLIITSLALSAVLVVLLVIFGFQGLTTKMTLGISSLIIGLCWLFSFLTAKKFSKKTAYWLLVVAGIFCGIAGGFFSAKGRFIDFLLWVSIGLGLPILVWGYANYYFGLIIAGLILLSSGVGVYIGWAAGNTDNNPLTQTGVMLIIFAFGWAGISALSRRCLKIIAWWPLVPAAVLLMSGVGLFMGGAGRASREYVGNTLSLALIVLGLYVLLLRSGFRAK
jgi:hypothetical protein